MKTIIVDSICGSGKTSWAIKKMNTEIEQKFIYITPYLDEVKRVIDGCPNRYFEEPKMWKGQGSKLEDFNRLLSEGKNICSTHALFSLVNDDTLKYLKENEYILILDEVFNVIEEINIKKSDRNMLLDTHKIEIQEDNKVVWLDDEYDGNLNEYKNKIQNGDVYIMNNSFLLWTFPTKIMQSLKETYVLTYKFEGQLQRYYYDMNNIEYKYKSVDYNLSIDGSKHYYLCEYNNNKDLSYLKDLITICENEKLNAIGKPKDKRGNPLSKSWYDNQSRKKLDGMDILKKNMENFFQKICKGKSDENMWTCFKDYKSKCKGKGYSKGFVSCNARATNEYRHKKNLAYVINTFNNPKILEFFRQRDVKVNEDEYALAELIQWLFRSQLRDGKPINLYIPSERMRKLLKDWLN